MDRGAGLRAKSYSVKSVSVRASSSVPYRPLRSIQDGLLLDLPEGLLWADRVRSAAVLFPVKQPVTSEFTPLFVDSGIIWCQVSLSVIPAEFSVKQSAGLTKRSAGNLRFHAKRPIQVRKYHKYLYFAFILFAMFQSINMTSFKKIGARAMKNEPKWWVSFFGHPVDTYNSYISDLWYLWPDVRSISWPHHYKSMGKN